MTNLNSAAVLADRIHDQITEVAPCDLAHLRDLRRALLATLDEVTDAMAPKMREMAGLGFSQQAIGEESGYSIQAVRRIVVPGAAEKDKTYRARRPEEGPKPPRGKDRGARVSRGRSAQRMFD